MSSRPETPGFRGAQRRDLEFSFAPAVVIDSRITSHSRKKFPLTQSFFISCHLERSLGSPWALAMGLKVILFPAKDLVFPVRDNQPPPKPHSQSLRNVISVGAHGF